MLIRRVVVVAEPLSKSLGAVAQLAERLHGMQEVTGSNPVSSTPSLNPMLARSLALPCRGARHQGSAIDAFDISVAIEGVLFNLRACGVAIAGGRVLLHRLRGDPFWSLPGGRCRIDETLPESLVREIEEEVGVTVAVGRLLWAVEYFFERAGVGSFHELGFYFAIDSPEQLVHNCSPVEDSLEFAWFPRERLPTVKPEFLAEALANELPRSAGYMTLRST